MALVSSCRALPPMPSPWCGRDDHARPSRRWRHGVASIARPAGLEVMILAGVAMGSLCWRHDVLSRRRCPVGRHGLLTSGTSPAGGRDRHHFPLPVLPYFAFNCGTPTPSTPGRDGRRLASTSDGALLGMSLASLVTAVIISFAGVIGFVGFVCPRQVAPHRRRQPLPHTGFDHHGVHPSAGGRYAAGPCWRPMSCPWRY